MNGSAKGQSTKGLCYMHECEEDKQKSVVISLCVALVDCFKLFRSRVRF